MIKARHTSNSVIPDYKGQRANGRRLEKYGESVGVSEGKTIRFPDGINGGHHTDQVVGG